ncbi:hypothetical protein CLCR_01046 [Cladophialophora carrionii]|uniref:NACHT domain-containing protein n=1 Tax=Cladophialophora carrionii TaxID=86049 RepID=A0A1C1CCK8_9EURO|nr:hypothetical protein CLCR_01046 [Cladophialophora carrionii]
MDPVTALGVACNIVTLVEPGIEAAAVCKELYKRGSLDENNNIERYADGLTAANNELQAVLKPHATTRASRLQQIAQDASKIAADLKTELNKLKLSKSIGNRQTGSAFKTTLKTMFKRGTIDKLLKALEKQESALQSGLLKELYIKAGQDDLARRKEFKALDQAWRDTIVQILGRLQLASTDIETSIKATGASITGRLDNHHSAQTSYLRDQQLDGLRVRLLDALAFPEMNERRNMIEQRVSDFGSTYGWVLGQPDKRFFNPFRSDDHEFVEWLRNGKELFWVSGKPGSGKSSLMDFIYQNIHARGSAFDMLAEWARPMPVQVLTFWFFRPASSVLLKSLQGMWRSLCFQMLEQNEKLVETIRTDDDGLAPASLKSCLTMSGSRARTWTDTELRSWFEYLITHSEYKYCILVDGLDEVASDHEALLHDVRYIVSISKTVKICCSSRPEPVFKRTLCNYPSLRLQDFNHNDIRMHCQERLEQTRAAKFATRIADMADGVFLWAALVAGDLKNAAGKGDSEEDLELRLEGCPTGMNDLFTFLLEKQDTFYAKHPEPYLALIHAATKAHLDITSFELLLASSGREQLKEFFESGLNDSRLAALDTLVSNMEVNIVARCANLVETGRDTSENLSPKFPAEFSYESLDKARTTTIRFIHRSAQDFLVESEKGAALLQSCGIAEQDAVKLLMLSSAVISAIDLSDVSAEKMSVCGSNIQRDFWTPYETYVADSVFASVQVRIPRGIPWNSAEPADGQQRTHDYNPEHLGLFCPQISVQQNVALHYAVYYGMVAYLNSKLVSHGSSVSSELVSFCLIQWIYKGRDSRDDLIRVLKKRLSWKQSLTVCYKLADIPETVFSPPISLPLWQHMYIAVTRSYLETNPAERPPSLHSSLGHIPVSDPGNPYVESIIFFKEWDIYMCPTTSESMVSVEGSLCSYHVFKLRVKVDESTGAGLISLDFRQYSPAGLTRFFEIDPTINHALQGLFHTTAMWGAYNGCTKFLVSILNQNLDRLAAVEIAQILTLPSPSPWESLQVCRNVIFSEGEFRFVDQDSRKAWEDQLKLRRGGIHGDEIFEDDTEPDRGGWPDSVLSEIVKAFEPKRRRDELQKEKSCQDEEGMENERRHVNE